MKLTRKKILKPIANPIITVMIQVQAQMAIIHIHTIITKTKIILLKKIITLV